MKRTIIVAIALLFAVAACKNNQKVYYESELKKDQIMPEGTDVDWIALYLRCHDIDSIKNVALENMRLSGAPVVDIPDSLGQLWNEFNGWILHRNGRIAFDELYDKRRDDFARYLQLDFINYSFTTMVYLPYKATTTTKEDYAGICIRELEREYVKAQQKIMFTQQMPDYYESLQMQLLYAYINGGRENDALAFCDELLSYAKTTYGEDSISYATMLNNKANLCNNMGNAYSAIVSAKRALSIYDKCLSELEPSDPEYEQLKEEKASLEAKIKLWQGQ